MLIVCFFNLNHLQFTNEIYKPYYSLYILLPSLINYFTLSINFIHPPIMSLRNNCILSYMFISIIHSNYFNLIIHHYFHILFHHLVGAISVIAKSVVIEI
jgi:hypothetical protein